MNPVAELKEFAEDFSQTVLGRASTNGNYAEDAFFEVFCEYLMEVGEIDSADRALYRSDSTLGIRVDGYGGDPLENSGILSLIVADYNPPGEIDSLNRAEMERILKQPVRFLQNSLNSEWRKSLEESSPGFGLASLLATRWKFIKSIRIILISNRELRLRVDGMPADEVQGVPVTFNVWDITRLQKLVESGQNREEMEIDLKNEFGGSVSILAAHSSVGYQESYLAVLPGEMLAKIYGRWGARLLEQNVRVFLQARGKVNKGIRETLTKNPDMFFSYNNGITCTAESISITEANGNPLLSKIGNFQIVNGGQTTASIYAAYLDDIDISDVYVQMKLCVVQTSENEKIVPKISEFANTQNLVQAADFFSNHPFHVRIEEFSRRIFAPSAEGTFRQSKWFYERARGQYADAKARLTKAERKKFEEENPKSQLIKKTDLGKYLNVWEEKPERVHFGAQKNFSHFAKDIGRRWEKNSNAFSEDFFREAVAKAIVFKATEKLVSSQPWYEGGYRANIVAYSISKLANMVAKRDRAVDFSLIWRHQDIGKGITLALTAIAEEVLGVLRNTPSTISNVTEWAKKQACWEEIRQLRIDWIYALNHETITIQEQKNRDSKGQKNQKELLGIKAQNMVANAGSVFWQELFEWASAKDLLSQRENGILEVAVQMESTSRPPSDKQAIVILEIHERMKQEGYSKELVES